MSAPAHGSSGNTRTPACPDRPQRVVAHVHTTYLKPSETFIHHYLANHRRFAPIVLARELMNLDRFPLPPGDVYRLDPRRHGVGWLVNGLSRRLLGRDLRGRRILAQRDAALVHAHFGPSGVVALPLVRGGRRPLVTTFYGHDLSARSLVASLAPAYRRLFDRGNLFLVEGPHMCEQLHAIGCPAEKIAIQRIALPVAALGFRARLAKPRGEPVRLLAAGRFVEKKGFAYTLEAVRAAREHHPDLELRIVGDGPDAGAISAEIARLGIESNVRLLGFLGYADYLAELEAADIFIQPSVTAADGDSEGGAPTSILEAQALGVPVLASRHADIPNVVDDGRSALLSPERDAAVLAGHLLRLLADPDSWAEMGRAGRRFVETHHDIGPQVVELERKYDLLVDRPS
ncbi:MAG: glycosyltransferase [Thermoleophilia bacterium]|nr:glycosyltransferase [Thermoleophilia bacterium]